MTGRWYVSADRPAAPFTIRRISRLGLDTVQVFFLSGLYLGWGVRNYSWKCSSGTFCDLVNVTFVELFADLFGGWCVSLFATIVLHDLNIFFQGVGVLYLCVGSYRFQGKLAYYKKENLAIDVINDPVFPTASWSFESLKEQNNFMKRRRTGGAPNIA